MHGAGVTEILFLMPCNILQHLALLLLGNLWLHRCRRSNVFWNARFLFWPNLITFAQILPQFCPNFALFCPNLTNFAKKVLLGDTTASPAPTELDMYARPHGCVCTDAWALPEKHNGGIFNFCSNCISDGVLKWKVSAKSRPKAIMLLLLL